MSLLPEKINCYPSARLLQRSSMLVLALLCQLAVAGEQPPGEFELSYSPAQLVTSAALAHFGGLLDPQATVTWSVYVPPGYKREEPAGLLVYASPEPSGAIPEFWKPVMVAKNLIWIGADGSGNDVNVSLRVSYALLATVLGRQQFTIDPARVYITGLSGGGRVASAIAPQYPHIFRGAIYNCGANTWGEALPQRIDEVRANRYVFVTGTEDFNRKETRQVYAAYRRAGVEAISFMDISHMGHRNPGPAEFAQAIDFLDGVSVGAVN